MNYTVSDVVRSRKNFDRDQPVGVFESPHNGKAVPPHLPHSIALPLLNSHNGWDPGASKLQRALRLRFMWRANARFITSRISRQVVDHNRTKRFASRPYLTKEQRKFYIDHFHAPYIGTVYSEINKIIADQKFPIVFNIHTYEPVLNGNDGKPYNRKLFSISGDPNSVIVKTFQKYMREELVKSEIKSALENLRLSEEQFLDDLNKPYNLGPLEENKNSPGTFKKNPLRVKNMAMRYAKNYGFPWVHLETRNDMAQYPVVQKIVVNVIEAVLNDRDVLADWKTRRDRYFANGPRRISRTIMHRPLPKPRSLRMEAAA